MRHTCGFLFVLLALVSFFAIATPHQALAAATPVSNCDPGQPKANMDTQAANNRQAYAQSTFNGMKNVNGMFPIIPAVNACVQQLTDLIAKLPSMGNPFSLGQMLINSLISSVISQTCSSLMATITSAENAISSFAHICLPLPKFNGLDIGQLPNASGCSSGTQVNLITGWSSSASARPTYNYHQFIGQ